MPTGRDARGRVTVLPPALRERCWPPGQSGNPNGTGGEYQRCLKLCREASHAAAEEIIRLSKESDDERVRYMAATWVFERAWGKPREYDPSKEQAERPKFDPMLLSPQQRNQVEAALRLMAQAVRMQQERQEAAEPEIIPPGEDEGIDGHDR